MDEGTVPRFRHFILESTGAAEKFRLRAPPVGKPVVPPQDRARHSSHLLSQLDALKLVESSARGAQDSSGMEAFLGIQIEVTSFPDIELAFESLARERSGIELLNVRKTSNCTAATVFVPFGKLAHFERLVQDYLAKKTDKKGQARDNRKLIDAVEDIRSASFNALWTDDPLVFPRTEDEHLWWEIWLPLLEERSATVNTFRKLASAQGLRVTAGEVWFPERTVLMAYASAGQLKSSMMTLNCIAELRRAKETANFFDSQPPVEQVLWLQELLARTTYLKPSAQTPYVCILDTGVNNGHPLLEPVFEAGDLHTVEPDWGVNDEHGHGTAMAGLALVGNLAEALDSSAPIEIGHRLESVKLLPHDGANVGDPQHHGYLTTEAILRPEIRAPFRSRVFEMAVTAEDSRDRGRPSAWSATLDRLTFDSDNQGANPRLVVVSAGNIQDAASWAEYPESNATEGIRDPAQAWNALTVGAFTELVQIDPLEAPDCFPIAPAGALSPFSTTSLIWRKESPLKPDVVFEGGNVGINALGPATASSLSLLTTNYLPTQLIFTTAEATSAASALAAKMAAEIMVTYPGLRPETIRGLIVHSADWTDEMRHGLPPQPTKAHYLQLLRSCGFGVPNLERALWSLNNSLTIVTEDELQPFRQEKGRSPTTNHMHHHALPWPILSLEGLSDTPVEMRVTLSYFIEPNPSSRGIQSRYRYPSHGLRFDVKRPFEGQDDFRKRINAAVEMEEGQGRLQQEDRGQDAKWLIGTRSRHLGSIHQDIWQGTAAELASRGAIAVYPTLGWWKTRPKLQRVDQPARYSLIVSIKAPEVEVDLYNEVASRIEVSPEIKV